MNAYTLNICPRSKNYQLPPKKKRKPGRHYVNPFSTNRKSSSLTAQSWRKSLPLTIALQIEKDPSCSDMMATYGYNKLPEGISEEDYTNVDGYKLDFF